jgi:predicted dehydrogenase
LADRFRVTAVYDQVARRAKLEATNLGCAACDGLVALIGRDDVDVVYVLAPQWFGLHPAELACDARKPIYCALPMASDPTGLESLAMRVRNSATPFMPELARRFYPVTLRLRELLATRLGPPRLVLAQSRLYGFDRYSQPGPSTQLAPAPLAIDPGGYLLDWCRFLFGSEPVSVQGFGGAVLPSADGGHYGPDFESFSAEFGHGELAHVSFARYHRASWGEASRFLPAPGFQVYAERGVAWLEMPDRIQWSDVEGVHEERLPLEPTVGEVLNDQFHRMVRGDQSLAPSIDDAVAVARLVCDLQRSRREGRPVAPRGPKEPG